MNVIQFWTCLKEVISAIKYQTLIEKKRHGTVDLFQKPTLDSLDDKFRISVGGVNVSFLACDIAGQETTPGHRRKCEP
jgi:hypothetical protein